MKKEIIIYSVVALVIGALIGGVLFSKSSPSDYSNLLPLLGEFSRTGGIKFALSYNDFWKNKEIKETSFIITRGFGEYSPSQYSALFGEDIGDGRIIPQSLNYYECE
ncbi:MAG: hypothetical protein AABY22_22550, partial [Nanoarchaeota archaeon]